MSYVKPYEIGEGDTVRPGGLFASAGVVVEVRDPTHALAGAYGAIVFDVDYQNGHAPHPWCVFPDREVWRDDA